MSVEKGINKGQEQKPVKTSTPKERTVFEGKSKPRRSSYTRPDSATIDAQAQEVRELWNKHMTDGEIARKLRISRSSVKRRIAKLREGGYELEERKLGRKHSQGKPAEKSSQPRSSKSEPRKDRAIKLWEQDVPVEAIAKQLHITPRAVYKRLEKLPPEKRPKSTKFTKKIDLSFAAIRDELLRLVNDENLTITEIAHMLGVSRKTIRRGIDTLETQGLEVMKRERKTKPS